MFQVNPTRMAKLRGKQVLECPTNETLERRKKDPLRMGEANGGNYFVLKNQPNAE